MYRVDQCDSWMARISIYDQCFSFLRNDWLPSISSFMPRIYDINIIKFQDNWKCIELISMTLEWLVHRYTINVFHSYETIDLLPSVPLCQEVDINIIKFQDNWKCIELISVTFEWLVYRYTINVFRSYETIDLLPSIPSCQEIDINNSKF